MFYQSMKNFSFALPAGMLLPNVVMNIFVGFQLFDFLSFLFLLSIRQDILSIKSGNALLLNIGRVSLLNFVKINLLGGFSWLFLGVKVKAFIKPNTKYAN